MQWLYSIVNELSQRNYAYSEDSVHKFTRDNQVKQNFSQKVQPQLPWPHMGCALSLMSPTLMTDNQPNFVLDNSQCFATNLLLSQPLLSDSWKEDMIFYVLFWVGSHSHSAISSQFISDKQNSKMYNLKVLWKLKCTYQMIEEKAKYKLDTMSWR